MPVGWRSISLASMSASGITTAVLASEAKRLLRLGAAPSTTVSISVFQASQCGHLPSQRGLVPPHSVQV